MLKLRHSCSKFQILENRDQISNIRFQISDLGDQISELAKSPVNVHSCSKLFEISRAERISPRRCGGHGEDFNCWKCGRRRRITKTRKIREDFEQKGTKGRKVRNEGRQNGWETVGRPRGRGRETRARQGGSHSCSNGAIVAQSFRSWKTEIRFQISDFGNQILELAKSSVNVHSCSKFF